MGPEDSRRHRLRVAVIIGSAQEGRSADAVDGWLAANARLAHFDLDLIEVPLPADLAAPPIYRADAYLVLAPDRPARMSAPADSAWHAKPVAFVPYSGVHWGCQVAERLRQAFADLHATAMRDLRNAGRMRVTAATMLDWLESRSATLFATSERTA
ncbi:hypothetical protein AB0B28_00440 [Glycomyces sp. NPDC046736]|uniref:hypothetical protein n=1 Tax=Glycomyces sp. NPDC046736 TaxID=3155615 RepID=UPI0033E4F342